MGIKSYQTVPYLRAWRAVAGLTQKRLAQECGVTPYTLRRIEQGHATKATTVAAIARALQPFIRKLFNRDLTIRDLIDHDPTMDPPDHIERT